MSDGALRERFVACLVGGAIGDALGYPIEFMTYHSICARFGSQGIQEYWLEETGGTALFSDDTQMTLFTAEGLVQAGAEATRTQYASSIYQAYLDWLHTQESAFDGRTGHTWLLGVSELYARRAPGGTCLSALESGKMGTIEETLNNSKGCGGVMRVAPAGLFLEDPVEAALVAAEAAAITHSHPMGYIPAAALAYIVSRCTYDTEASLEAVVRECIEGLPSCFEGQRYYAKSMGEQLSYAIELAHGDATDSQNIPLLGEGWVGDEALAISVYSALRHEGDFTKTIISAVNHGGDADSTGAIAGNIAGAQLGSTAIEARWTDSLELREVIERVAIDLYLKRP